MQGARSLVSLSALTIAIALCMTACAAGDFPAYKDKYVNDFAGILGGEAAGLRTLLSNLEKNTTAEVTVVTLENTSPYTPSEYRTLLFKEWGVGKKGEDNGLLILYAKAERRIEVEVGYGLEGILPDSKVGRLLDEYYVPLRDQNKTAQGIANFTVQVSAVISMEYSNAPDELNNWDIFAALIVIGIVVIIIIYFIAAMRKPSRGSKKRSSGFSEYGGYSGGMLGGGGFGGFGGGGGGFGGGRSGGGGVGR